MNIRENKRYANSVTGFRGVTVKKTKSGTRYQAKLYINAENTIQLGRHDTALEAAKAYDKAAFEDGRPLFKLNFPEEWAHIHRDNAPSEDGGSRKSSKSKKSSKSSSPKKKSKGEKSSGSDGSSGYKRKGSAESVGYRGVYQIGNKFRASITVDRKTVSLGTYTSAKKAALAWDRGVIKFGRPKDYLNFKDGEVPSSDDEEEEYERRMAKKHKSKNGGSGSDADEDTRDWFGRKISQYQKPSNKDFIVNI
jgi:hypothetical protein